MKPYLHVRQVGSLIGEVYTLRRVVRGLGLRRPGSEVVVANTPSFRGMVKKVMHLVQVEEVAEAPAKKSPAGGAPRAAAPQPKK